MGAWFERTLRGALATNQSLGQQCSLSAGKRDGRLVIANVRL